MYERMLDKTAAPAIEEMTEFCGGNGERFTRLNQWLASGFHTEQKIVFPYGNRYGWGVAHKRKNQLICNIFAEDNAFTVMVRLRNKDFDAVYPQLQEYGQKLVDGKYPCGDGGWIHYRVIDEAGFEEVKKLLTAKCSS